MKGVKNILILFKQALVICVLVFACACQMTTMSTGPLHRGIGESWDPFLVYTLEDLERVGKPIADGTYDNWDRDKHYKQVNDINFSSISNWTRIGESSTSPFSGVYDGSNKKIINLQIGSSSYNYQGLFGYISGDGTTTGIVKNLRLVDVHINSTSTVGGVVGYNDGGAVQNCYVTGIVRGSSVIGGVVGRNDGSTSKVENCYAMSDVEGTSTQVGGIIMVQ